jgi:hypothetical protein
MIYLVRVQREDVPEDNRPADAEGIRQTVNTPVKQLGHYPQGDSVVLRAEQVGQHPPQRLQCKRFAALTSDAPAV